MATRRAPDNRGGWARLSAGIIHDPDWLDLDAAGRLCFMTSIALAKATNCDGEFSLRAMIGIQAGALTEKQVRAAAVAVTAAGLWEHVGGERYRVRSFTRWNETVAEQDERREAKRLGALKTNHKLGRHDDAPDSDCPECRSSDAPANARANAKPEVPAKPTASLDKDGDGDGDGDGDQQHPPDPPATQAETGTDLAVVVLADSLVAQLGYPDPPPAGPDERRYVAKALARGWTADQLTDVAVEASARDDVDDVRRYLLGVLRNRANTDPPPAQAPPTRRGRDSRSTADIAAATYVPYQPPAEATA